MPAAAAVVISDGASTPVAHTFTPIGKDPKGVITFEQTTPTATTPIEAKKLSYRQVRGTATGSRQNGVGKVVYTLSLPKAETVSNNSNGLIPPPTLAYELKARIEIDIPERSTLQERKDLRVLMYNLLSHGTTGNLVIDSLLPMY